MAKPKHEQMDFDGLEIVADEFTGNLTGNVTGTVTGALTGLSSVTITATSGTLPTANGAVTVADATTPTVVELLEAVVELNAKVAAIIAALD